MARVMTSGSESKAGRPGFLLRAEEGWCSCHQSSTSTYNETRKESRSMRHHLWAKVWYQHRVSAPSASPAITHQTSKASGRRSEFAGFGLSSYTKPCSLKEKWVLPMMTCSRTSMPMVSPASHTRVVTTRSSGLDLPRRVVVGEDHGGGTRLDGRLENLAGVDEGGREGADRDRGASDDGVLRIEQDDDE